MTGNPYVIPFPWRNVAATVVLAAVLWGAPFVIWPRAAREPHRGQDLAPMKIKFLGAVQGVDGSAWSPVVFPLPTKYGFSERADSPGLSHDMSQVFQPNVAEGVFLELPALATPPAEIGMLDGGRGDASFRPAGVRAPVFRGVRPVGTEPWQIEMDESLRDRRFTVESLKEVVPDAGQRGSLEAYVELDRGGSPLHVLLDSSSGNTNIDQAAVRALYTGRGQRGDKESCGRIRLSYWRAGESDGQGAK